MRKWDEQSLSIPVLRPTELKSCDRTSESYDEGEGGVTTSLGSKLELQATVSHGWDKTHK